MITFPQTISPVAHSSADLAYRLVRRKVSLEPLRIYAQREVLWHGWQIRFYVLGASHAMVLKRGRSVITELLTCSSAHIDSGGEFRLAGSGSLATEVAGLSFDVQIRTCSGEDPRWSQACDGSLDWAFENLDADEPSWTKLRWRMSDDSLTLTTLHTYPQESVCVLSETVVTPIDEQIGIEKEIGAHG